MYPPLPVLAARPFPRPWLVTGEKALGSEQGQREAWHGPAELRSPRPAGADAAAECTHAPAASDCPGGSSPRPLACLAPPSGAWAGGGGVGGGPPGRPSAGPEMRSHLGFPDLEKKDQATKEPETAHTHLAGSLWHLLSARPRVSLHGVAVGGPQNPDIEDFVFKVALQCTPPLACRPRRAGTIALGPAGCLILLGLN